MNKIDCIAIMAAIGDSYTRDFGFKTKEDLVKYMADLYEAVDKEIVKRRVGKG